MSAPLALIAALDRRHAIGRGNALPWHLPADLARFKQLTLGQPILMGRKTAESLGRALPGRRNLVLSRRDAVPFVGMERVASLAAARQQAAEDGAGWLWVIGGGEVYREALPEAERLCLTWVETEVADADAFFPPFSATIWQEVARQRHPADARHPFAFSFAEYRRRA